MYRVLLAVVAVLNISAAQEPQNSNFGLQDYNTNNFAVAQKPKNKTIAYVDKDENMLKMPLFSKFINEHKTKKKIKKTPKRTIQKIIKKNKGKLRKVYLNQVTRRSTMAPKINYDNIYGQDENMKRWKVETTTQVRHKPRNRNTKVIRYHMPFQKLQKNKDNKRHKRGLSRELYILKDLDQIQFLSKEKDNDVVNAHVTNYWKV